MYNEVDKIGLFSIDRLEIDHQGQKTGTVAKERFACKPFFVYCGTNVSANKRVAAIGEVPREKSS